MLCRNLIRHVLCLYIVAFEVDAGHTDAVLLGRRIFDRIRRRTVHVVPDFGDRVTGDADPLF